MQPAATLRVLVDVDSKRASAGLTKFDQQLKAAAKSADANAAVFGKQQKQLNLFPASVDKATKSSKGLTKAQADLGKATDDNVSRFRSLSRSYQKHSVEIDRTTKKVGEFSDKALTMADGTKKIEGFVSVLKMPGVLAALGPAAAGVQSLAGGVAALTGAMAPLAGLATGLGTLVGVLGQVKFTTQLSGIKEVTSAVGGLNEALDKTSDEYKQLTPEGQKLARTLNQFKQPLQDIQKSIQAPLFRGMTRGLREVAPALDVVEKILQGTARQLGGLAEQAGKAFGNEGTLRDLEKFGKTNNEVIGRLGPVIIRLGKALLGVMVVARPLTNWMSRLAATWGDNIAAMLEAGRRSGDLARFFEQTKEVTSDLLGLFGHLSAALGNITKLGAPLGREIIDRLNEGAEALHRWTESASGKNAIKEYFDSIAPALFEAGKLLRDIVKAFFDVSKHSQGLLVPLLRPIRKELLPLFTEVVNATSKALGPKLIDLLKELATHFLHLAGTSGPLNIWIEAMTNVTRALNWMIENVPGFQQVIVTLLGFRAVSKTMAIAGGVTGVGALVKGLKFLILPGTINSLAAMSPMLTNMATKMGLLTVTTEGLTVATRALVSATVIGAVITAGIVIATHWEETKKVFASIIGVLEDVWAWFKGHSFVALLLGPFGLVILAVKAFIDNFGAIKAVVSDVANVVADFAHIVGSVASSVANTVADIVHVFASVASKIANAFADVVSFLWPIAKKILEIVTWPGRTMISFWVGVVKRVVGVVKGIIGFLWPIVKKIVEVVSWPARKWFEIWKAIMGKVIGVVRDVFNWIKDHVGPVARWIGNAFMDAKDWVVEAFHKVKDFLSGVWQWIEDKANGVVGFFRDLPGKIGNVFHDVAKAISSPFKSAFETVVDAAKWMLDKLLGAFSTALDTLADIIGEIPEIEIFGEQITPDFSGIADDIRGTSDSINEFREKNLQTGDAVKNATAKTNEAFARSETEIGQATNQSGQHVEKFNRNTRDSYERTATEVAGSTGKIKRQSDQDTKEGADKGTRNAQDFKRGVGGAYERTATEVGQSTGKVKKDSDRDTKEAASKGTKNAQGFKRGVGGSYESASAIVGDALTTIEQNTNKALKGLKVKPIKFGTTQITRPGGGSTTGDPGLHTNQLGGLVGAQAGMTVPGRGSGDKVHMEALVEPGEKVFVLNRNASATLENLQRFNQEVPRFAAGGIVAAGKLAESMGMFVGEGPSGTPWGPTPTSGHASGSYHYSGEALDVSGGNMTKYFQAVFERWMGHGLAELFYDPIGWYVKHDTKVPGAIGDHGDHVHVAITSAFGGAMAELVKAIEIQGPEGPLKDSAQSATDIVRDAANAFIKKNAPTEGGELLTGSGDVEKVFAEVSKKLSQSKVATMALGEAGYAESGMQDLPGGDASSQGALQLLSSTASGMGINPHDEAAVSSAFYLRGYYGKGGANKLAASGLPPHLVAQGVQGSAFPSGSNYSAQAGAARGWMGRYGLQRGGLMRLKGGGEPNGNGKPGKPDEPKSPPITVEDIAFDPSAMTRSHVEGHGGETPEIDLRSWFGQMVQAAPVARMKEIIGSIGLNDAKFTKWSKGYTDALDQDEWATRAMALDTDTPTGGVVYGIYPPHAAIGGLGTDIGWLNLELAELFTMREDMVGAIPVVEGMIAFVKNKVEQMKRFRETAHRLETQAERAYNDLIRTIDRLERQLAELKRQTPEGKKEKEHHATQVTDLQDRIERLKANIPTRQAWWDAAKFRVGATQEITDAFHGHVSVLDGAITALKSDGFPDVGKDGVPSLEELQGRASTFAPLGSLENAQPPKLGGRIMEIQLQISEALKAAGEAAGGGAGEGGGGASEAALAMALATIQQQRVSLLAGPIVAGVAGGMPTFAGGGIMPGPAGRHAPALVGGREGVFTEDQMAAMGTGHITVEVTVLDPAVDPSAIRAVVVDENRRSLSNARRRVG